MLSNLVAQVPRNQGEMPNAGPQENWPAPITLSIADWHLSQKANKPETHSMQQHAFAYSLPIVAWGKVGSSLGNLPARSWRTHPEVAYLNVTPWLRPQGHNEPH